MLIIKPYGRSCTDFEANGKLRRKIRLDKDLGAQRRQPVDVGEFAKTHPELVIAQWISAIDKIAGKPSGGNKPTPEQRGFRQRLGKAALQLLTEKGLLDLSDRKGELEKLWWSKVHPYGKEDTDRVKGRKRGRWYKRFAGETEPAEADAAVIVEKIREHLHEREYRIAPKRPSNPERPSKRRGRITARAESIIQSVPPLLSQFPDRGCSWSAQDEKDYEKAGNVAARIREAAEKLEKEAKGRNRPSVRDAAPALYEQYGRLFQDGNGTALHIPEAGEKSPGLFALHCAVKETYTRVLKNHRPLKTGQRKSVAQVLPADMETLFRLVKAKSANRDLNDLVRLGKFIHYNAGPANVVDKWQPDVARSRYRTTDGQSEIKRTEAFTRVWRNTIALAARTLKDWADPDGNIPGDILLKVGPATGPEFDASAYSRKLPLLFGNRACRFTGEDDAFQRSVLRLALCGWAKLRHSSFHFKERGAFVKALKTDFAGVEAGPVTAAHDLWRHDVEGRWNRLIADLRAAHVEHYFDQGRLDALVEAVVTTEPSRSPLPRFRRVLDRAEKAWRRKPHVLRLPRPSNRAELEKPGFQCRYVVTKTLYDKAFPEWLERQTAATLNEWIERAEERTTTEARSINKDESAVARADGLIRLRDGKGIADFVDQLSARTATEFRVQRGYDSDADQARKQSQYLDNLRCDVVGQAFEAYLKDARLTWVLDDLSDDRPEDKRGYLDKVPHAAKDSSRDAKDWEAVLYFLIHLVPVDVVGRLLHQLRKWSILERKRSVSGDSSEGHEEAPESDEAGSVIRILGLYLDMHDAKFEGGVGMAGAKALKDLFETEDAFERVCPEQPGEVKDRYVPWRGLREILRFGGLASLRSVFEKHPITAGEVNKLEAWEAAEEDGLSLIAEQQKERERLHEEWSRKKRKFRPEDRKAYRKALAAVVEHRRLAAHVRLNNHARLHNLLMGVLGRLVDYAGLWERDLYFTTLALIDLEGRSPKDAFPEDGLEHLRNGRIVEAVRKLEQTGKDGKAIVDQLKRLFGTDFLHRRDGVVPIRNDLAHFNMLQGSATLDLTEAVNDTRRLMAYDRKLKNAVSQSIIEMLAREGLYLTWDMKDHSLTNARVNVRQAVHLEDQKIKEDLHGEQFVKMVADLFGGEALPSKDDVLSVNANESEPTRKGGQIPKGSRKNQRNRRGNRGGKGRS